MREEGEVTPISPELPFEHACSYKHDPLLVHIGPPVVRVHVEVRTASTDPLILLGTAIAANKLDSLRHGGLLQKLLQVLGEISLATTTT